MAVGSSNGAGRGTKSGAARGTESGTNPGVGIDVARIDGAGIDVARLPNHVACVMDGNGRWATARGLDRTDGHAAGEAALIDTIEGASEIGLRYLTVYAFSTENWRRPTTEVSYLMNFNQDLLIRRSHELNDNNVRIRFVGRRGKEVPRRVARRIDEAVEMTKDNTGLTFTVAFNYGGRAEITDAARAIAAAGLTPESIDEGTIAAHLYDATLPDVDLLIRTSGEARLSNFLLWQVAYSELVFTETLWPDFRRTHLFDAIAQYQARERRFGGLTDLAPRNARARANTSARDS